jgi:Xaa-Pro dipeptidase
LPYDEIAILGPSRGTRTEGRSLALSRAIGDTEYDAQRKFNLRALELGAKQTPRTVVVSGQYGYDQPNTGPTNRMVRTGDLLFIDTGCEYDHYYCDFDRHFSFGEATSQTKRAYDVLYRSTEAGLAAVEPGRTMSDVYQAMWRVLDKFGFASNSGIGRMGHGMGLAMPEPPSIKPDDHTVIEAGMILNLEPSLAYVAREDGQRRIMVHEENIAVTPDGYELLTRRAPQEIPVISS